MNVIVLAAGYATRLYPLTLDMPKALLEIGDRSMLDHIVDEIDTLDGVSSIIIVSNSKFHRHFSDWAGTRKVRSEIFVLDDGTSTEDTRLGAIGDIQFAILNRGLVHGGEDILVMASDNFFTFKLLDAYNFYKKKNRDCILVNRIDDLETLKRFGVAILDGDGKVVDLEEKPQNPRSDMGAYGMYFYLNDTLPLFKVYLDEGNKPDAPGNFPAWLCRRKEVYAYTFEGICYDIGTHEALDMVRREFVSGRN
jgi:glucose-1-phosphate thymidylyltransferase